MQFIFDSAVIKREIMRLKTHALANPIDLRNGIPEDLVPVGEDPNHVMVNGNMKIVYSMELHPDSLWCHHLSISKKGKEPPVPEMVNDILSRFGMWSLEEKKGRRNVYLEDGFALNVIQEVIDG